MISLIQNRAAQNIEEAASLNCVFELYVCGMTKKALKTITAVKAVLDQELHGSYTLRVVDVFKNPQAARQAQVMTTPLLIKKAPRHNGTLQVTYAAKTESFAA